KKGGIFKSLPPDKLGAAVIRSFITENEFNVSAIYEVIFGSAINPGGNLSRFISLTEGLPVHISGVIIDRQWCTRLEAINYTCRIVQAGAGDIYIAGGVESSSLAPWKMAKPNSLYSTPTLFVRARFSPESIGDPDMGVAADNVAHRYHISRAEQDDFALNSHQKAVNSHKKGHFKDEIVPLLGHIQDEGPRSRLNKK